MQTFEIEFEALPTERITPAVLETARALAERTGDLLEERVENPTTEHEAAAVTPDLNGPRTMSIPAPATPTGAEAHQPAGVGGDEVAAGTEPAPPAPAE